MEQTSRTVGSYELGALFSWDLLNFPIELLIPLEVNYIRTVTGFSGSMGHNQTAKTATSHRCVPELVVTPVSSKLPHPLVTLKLWLQHRRP